ncbi:MAG: hypothetical protein FJX03_01615 [Alphaproteobacteria bacterium]|nr:hypothetical protein [Alphaproteobacteria bacterium]
MIPQLLINEPPLQVLPTLAKTIGLNEAIVLQQVHYWLNPQFNKNFFEERYWVYNTFTQWHQQFQFWSKKTIKRTIANLEESGLLISFVTRGFKRTKYYTLDYDLLKKISLSVSNIQILDRVLPKRNEVVNDSVYSEKQETHSWGQNDPLDEPKMGQSMRSNCLSRQGQLVPNDGVRMTLSHYTENTQEITSETTLPPLSPPSSNFVDVKFKEEEEEKINRFQNLNSNSNFNHTLKQTHEEILEFWNQTVQCKVYSGKKVHLTKKRGERLKTLLETVFEGNIDSWRDYCTLIANSRYLAGENPRSFKATLDWALVPDNAYKVLEGVIYDQPQPAKMLSEVLPWEEFSEELVRKLPSHKCLLPWHKISLNLAKQIGQIKYKDWFLKVSLIDLTESKATLSVEGRFIKDYIATNFSSEILKAIQSVHPEIKHIDLKVVETIRGNRCEH